MTKHVLLAALLLSSLLVTAPHSREAGQQTQYYCICGHGTRGYLSAYYPNYDRARREAMRHLQNVHNVRGGQNLSSALSRCISII